MKYIIAILLVWMVGAISSQATTVSGIITNRHGFGIHDILITATQTGDSSHIITTNAGYGGPYSIELPEGSWTLELDPVQLGEWGYQPFSAEIVVPDTNSIVFNMVPLPIEPPIPPALSLSVAGDHFTLRVVGGGDRVFRVERSIHLESWSNFASTCTDNGRVDFGSNIIAPYTNRAMFRVIVTE